MKISKLIIVIAVVLFSNNTFAQKFAHISRDELVQSIPEVGAAQSSLESYGKELQSTIDDLQVGYKVVKR